jgi:hypothetical protein
MISEKLARLAAWLSMSDYYEAKDRATDRIIASLSRGNVAMQNGNYLDSDSLDRLSRDGDRATEELRNLTQGRAAP